MLPSTVWLMSNQTSGRARQPASAAFSERVSQIDIEVGRLEERRKQWGRIGDALDRRDALTTQVRELEAKIADLDDAVTGRSRAVDLDSVSEAIADGMNDYLRYLNGFRPGAWSQPEVGLWLRERQFRLAVGGQRLASRLGGTLKLYFILAYQYALLRLSGRGEFNYPGLAVVDMPAELADVELADLENFAIEPFVKLLASDGMDGCQMIVAGSSFKDLSGVHRIELDHVFG